MQGVFSRATKQVIVKLIPMWTNTLLVDLEEEKVLTPKAKAKNTLEKSASKKVVEEVAEGDEKSPFSSEFDDVFDVNYDVPR